MFNLLFLFSSPKSIVLSYRTMLFANLSLLFFFLLWLLFSVPSRNKSQGETKNPQSVTGCSRGAYMCICDMWVRHYWLLMYLHLDKCNWETCCRPQRHFQSYKSENYHSSLNGTAVCTQLSSHLKPSNIINVSKRDVQPEGLQTLQTKQLGFLSMFQENEVPLTSWLLLWIWVY